ncbi:hypothetical protein KIW84_063167 [Lathyrus oleraceus]|uniref:Uncharacterized protein n=1 Tax=Pisum sativum TaxID=3888 RepID=A0A9D5A7E2_PEA|nr:hypothetical protein KIW84_063167 [Pisum sativum]
MLTRLPYCHAISCMKAQQLEIDNFMYDCYKKACYEPPSIKRQRGRPKKKRTRDPSENMRDETQLKRANFGINCSMCHMIGHNKATCKLPAPSQTTQPKPSRYGRSQSGPSQPEPSQPGPS